MEFGRIGEISGKFRRMKWGVLLVLNMIQREFLGDFGATPSFWKNLAFGVVSGDLGPQKVFAQIVTLVAPCG